MTALVSQLYIIMILKFTFFGNNYNIGKCTSAASKERMTSNVFSCVSHLLITLYSHMLAPLHSVTDR